MKKKTLKNLKLYRHKVSNLTLLYGNIGGNINTNPNTIPTANTHDLTLVLECRTQYGSCIFLECITNSGDTLAPPPTEYEGCLRDAIKNSIQNSIPE